MYICIYVYMYICIYVLYMYICIYVYMYICIYVYTYMCIYVCVFIYIYIHTHMICIYISLCIPFASLCPCPNPPELWWTGRPKQSRAHSTSHLKSSVEIMGSADGRTQGWSAEPMTDPYICYGSNSIYGNIYHQEIPQILRIYVCYINGNPHLPSKKKTVLLALI